MNQFICASVLSDGGGVCAPSEDDPAASVDVAEAKAEVEDAEDVGPPGAAPA